MANDDETGLGDAAASGLGDVTGQEPLDPSLQFNTHLAFLGMGYRTNDDDYKLGQDVEFTVRGRVVEVGDKLMKDDHQRHVVKVDVTSVTTTE